MAIYDKLTYLEGTKSAIKDSIISKGVAVSDSDTFRSYADKISQISAGGVDVTATGMTFAYANLTGDNFSKIEWSAKENMRYLFYTSKIGGTIDLNDRMDSNTYYQTERMFQSTSIYEIKMDNKKVLNPVYMFNTCLTTAPSVITDLTVKDTSTLTQSWFAGTNITFKGTLNIYLSNAGQSTVAYTFNNFAGSKMFDKIVVTRPSTSTGAFSIRNFVYSQTITEVPEIDLTGVNNQSTFTNFGGSTSMPKCTKFGGIINLRTDIPLQRFTAIDSESVDNILNKAADLTGSTTQTITFATAVYNNLTDDQKALATSKNWTLKSA